MENKLKIKVTRDDESVSICFDDGVWVFSVFRVKDSVLWGKHNPIAYVPDAPNFVT